MTPVSSRLVQAATRYDSLVVSPFPPTVLRLDLNQTLPFHRLYYGRVSASGTNYLETVNIRFLSKGSEVWSTSFQESNQALADIIASATPQAASFGNVSPAYCIATVENDSTASAVDVQPRELLSGTDWLNALVRLRTTTTADLTTRITCAPLKVLAQADTVELTVKHDPGLTSADSFWAGRIWFLAVNSSNVPA